MFTPIILDKTRNFRFGMKAISTIEKTLGTSISRLDMDDLTMEQTAIIIWAGLVHEDKDLTPERVMELVDDHSNMIEALEIMGKAFADSFNGGKPPVKN